MRKAVLAAAIVTVLASFGSSHALVQVIVSAPAGQQTSMYEPVSVAVTSAPVTYLNLDPLGDHNVVSRAKKNPACTQNCQPLFKSGPPVPLGGQQTFDLTGVAPGDYGFFCEIHTSMAGTLTVVA